MIDRTLILMSIIYVFIMSIETLIDPFYPNVGVDKGCNYVVIRTIELVFPAAGITFSPIVVEYLKFRSYKSCILGGIAIQAVALVIFGLAVFYDCFLFCVISGVTRLVNGIGCALSVTSILAIVVNDY
jgi:hypothetical protein